jgi:hypothetical protein
MPTEYYRALYVRAVDIEDATECVMRDAAADGAELLELGEIRESTMAEIPISIIRRFAVGARRGICWKSGRVVYPME